MKVIRAYAARTQANRAKRTLDAAAILTLVIEDPCTQRVELWVPDELAEHAGSLLELSERSGRWSLCIAA